MKRLLLCQFGGIGEKIINETLCNMGYEVECLWIKSENYDYDKILLQKMIDHMKSAEYNYVFSLNFLPIISKVCNVFRTIYISWIYDCPELHMYSPAIHNPVNRLFIFDRTQYEHFKDVNPGNVFYQHLVTKPKTESELDMIEESDRRRFDHDISFIGSLYNEKERRCYDLLELPEYWKGFAQGIAEAQLNVFGYNFIKDCLSDNDVEELKRLLKYELIDDYERSDKEIIADMYIGIMTGSMDRIRTLKKLSEKYNVALYTDSDYSQLPKVQYKGLLDQDTEMPKLLNCSKINLNITLKTMHTGIPIRVFDTLGVKGFLITNYQQEIVELFEPDVDLVIYEDMNDLMDKVDYYLKHEEDRKRIADNGYRKVCKYYTYEKAMRNIMDAVGI